MKNKPIFIQEKVPLNSFSTFKVGGLARYFFSARDIDKLKEAIVWAKKEKITIFVLGGGSNILVSDEGFDGLVVKIDFDEVKIQDEILAVGAGVKVIPLARKLTKQGLSGLEWAGGLPGTFGGAVRGNAGAYRFDIAGQIKSVMVLHKGEVEELKPEECEFAYRTSIFKSKRAKDIILKMHIQLKKADSKKAWDQLQEWLTNRITHQPQLPSAGSVFKNYLTDKDKEFDRINSIEAIKPEFRGYKKIPSAWFIEHSGLKGLKVGGAEVSSQHANFIVNISASARAADIWELMRQVKQQVYNKFKVVLEEEVQLIGFEKYPPIVH